MTMFDELITSIAHKKCKLADAETRLRLLMLEESFRKGEFSRSDSCFTEQERHEFEDVIDGYLVPMIDESQNLVNEYKDAIADYKQQLHLLVDNL